MTLDIKEYHKDYYSRPEIKKRHSAYMKEYYQKHKETLLKKQKNYNNNNKESIRTYMREYMKKYNSNKIINKKSQLVDVSEKDEISTIADQD